MTASTVLDQNPVAGLKDRVLTQSIAVTGGTLYVSSASKGDSVDTGRVSALAQTFVPAAAGGLSRNLPLLLGRTDAGLVMTGSASTGVFGITRSAGATCYLVGETTSSNAKTDKVVFDWRVPDSYVAGQAISVVVHAQYTGSGTVTGASTTVALAAYTESGGVETAIAGITAAQQITNADGAYTFSIPGAAGLVAGQEVLLEITLVITSASGANTGQINSVAAVA